LNDVERRDAAASKASPHSADVLQNGAKLAVPYLELCLVIGESRLQDLRVAVEHARHLREAETKRAQRNVNATDQRRL